MKLDFGFLAESATLKQGQFSVLATFDTHLAAEFPAKLNDFTVALRISADPHELGEYLVRLELTDGNGRAIRTESGAALIAEHKAVFAPRPGGVPLPAVHQAAVRFRDFGLSSPGLYAFAVKVGEQTIGAIPFAVGQVARQH
jgi:hypothetical protein